MASPTPTAAISPTHLKRRPPAAVPSPSASVVLIAPVPERTADGYDYRVLLLKRHAKSSTFVSAHVFPGGNLDPSDSSTEWNSLFPAPATFTAGDSLVERALKICAARETFEECGVLLHETVPGTTPSRAAEIWAKVSDADRLSWRDKVHSSGSAFNDLFKYLSVASPGTNERPGVSMLKYRANWITPPSQKRRFDTHFFFAVLPSHTILPSSASTPLVTADGKETVSADWLTPAEGIRRALLYANSVASPNPGPPASGEEPIIFFPPQFYCLAELAATKSLAELELGERQVWPFHPQLATVKDFSGRERMAMVYPGDPCHLMTHQLGIKEGAEKKMNRSYLVKPAPGKQAGLTIGGCVRRGLEEALGAGWGDMQAGDVGVEEAKEKL